jgi:hypothetical protein
MTRANGHSNPATQTSTGATSNGVTRFRADSEYAQKFSPDQIKRSTGENRNTL